MDDVNKTEVMKRMGSLARRTSRLVNELQFGGAMQQSAAIAKLRTYAQEMFDLRATVSKKLATRELLVQARSERDGLRDEWKKLVARFAGVSKVVDDAFSTAHHTPAFRHDPCLRGFHNALAYVKHAIDAPANEPPQYFGPPDAEPAAVDALMASMNAHVVAVGRAAHYTPADARLAHSMGVGVVPGLAAKAQAVCDALDITADAIQLDAEQRRFFIGDPMDRQAFNCRCVAPSLETLEKLRSLDLSKSHDLGEFFILTGRRSAEDLAKSPEVLAALWEKEQDELYDWFLQQKAGARGARFTQRERIGEVEHEQTMEVGVPPKSTLTFRVDLGDDFRNLMQQWSDNLKEMRELRVSARIDEDLPTFLERVAKEILERDTVYGNFAQGIHDSLCGRAIILRTVAARAAAAGEQP